MAIFHFNKICVDLIILIMILILPCEREIGAEAGTIRIRNKLRHFLFTLFMFDLKWEETRVVIRNDIHHETWGKGGSEYKARESPTGRHPSGEFAQG